MRFRWTLIILFAVAAVGVAILALAAETSCAQAVTVKGTVQHKGTETGRWTALKAGAALRAGEWVRTGSRSQADLLILNRYRVRLNESTTIRIPQDTLAGHVHAIYLSTGRIWAQVFGDGKTETRFEVETDAAVAGVRGTIFSVSHYHYTTVSVYEGRVAVSDRKRERTVLLQAGTQTIVKPGRGPAPTSMLSKTEKDLWNKVRGWIQQGKSNSKNKDKDNSNGDEEPGHDNDAKRESEDENPAGPQGGHISEG